MKTHASKVLTGGIVFGEGPRWHDGKLWFSDMFGGKVMTVTAEGVLEEKFALAASPSGLGWDAQGRLLVVSMNDRKLVRWHGGTIETVAELGPYVGGNPNDMVVAANGRAYIGNFGYDLLGGEAAKATNLVLVEPDGKARKVADDLVFPNGMVISPDGKQLVVAETFAARLSAFTIAADGSLTNRRVFADLPGKTPDGICLDAEGAVWVASFNESEFLRVRDGGAVVERVPVPGKKTVACMLGGADRKTLFCLTAETSLEELHEGRSKGFVETVRVDVPGAGQP